LRSNENGTFEQKKYRPESLLLGNWRGAFAAAPHLSYDGKCTKERKNYIQVFPSENVYRAFAAAPHLPCNGKSILG
jgi:hypothetical protein